MRIRMIGTVALTVGGGLGALSAAGQDVRVTFTNNQPAGGFSTSPLWFSFHDASFDFFDAGSTASAATETLAELGNGAGLSAQLGAHGTPGVLTSGGALPEFTPGNSASTTTTVASASTFRWFSFAAMVVPSNDFFVGNDDATAFQIFDAAGNFMGPLTIQVFAQDAWESQTEVNNKDLGIAFLVGRDPAAGDQETGGVRPLFSAGGNPLFLQSIIGEDTPAYTVTSAPVTGQLLGTIHIGLVPSPGPGAVFGVALLGAGLRRRR
jgi:hypothetical protein